jgi:hypothetical protein
MSADMLADLNALVAAWEHSLTNSHWLVTPDTDFDRGYVAARTNDLDNLRNILAGTFLEATA